MKKCLEVFVYIQRAIEGEILATVKADAIATAKDSIGSKLLLPNNRFSNSGDLLDILDNSMI